MENQIVGKVQGHYIWLSGLYAAVSEDAVRISSYEWSFLELCKATKIEQLKFKY